MRSLINYKTLFDPVTVKIEVVEKPGRRSELVVSLVKPNSAGLIDDVVVDVSDKKKGTKREAACVSIGGGSAKKQKKKTKGKK